MPSGPFAHVCLLVGDLDQAVAQWTTILSVLDPTQVEEQIVRYDGFEGAEEGQMRWATFVSRGGAEIQLMEPAPESHLGKRLAKKGDHVHHICFTTEDPETASRKLAEQGIAISGELNSDPEMPWRAWTWILPKSANGTLVEIAKPYAAVGGKWEDGSR